MALRHERWRGSTVASRSSIAVGPALAQPGERTLRQVLPLATIDQSSGAAAGVGPDETFRAHLTPGLALWSSTRKDTRSKRK